MDLPRFDGVNDERILYLLGVDENRLLELLAEHRLPHRFLRRAAQERPGWCSRHLLGEVQRLCSVVQRRINAQLQAVREINTALAPRSEAAFIKGISIYALTGEPATLRFSADVDLFHEDLDHVWHTLERLGYEGCRRDGHEFGCLQRGDVVAEVHRYFPVLSYPGPVREADLAASRHPNRWRQPAWGERREGLSVMYDGQQRIVHADLTENAGVVRAPECEGLRFPDPSLLVLILCAHAFKNFVAPPFRHPLPVPLSTLADVRDLAQQTHFNPERFLALVNRFGGHDSLRLVRHLLRSLLGVDPLPHSMPRPRDGRGAPTYEPAERSHRLAPWRFLHSCRSRAGSIAGFPRLLSYHGCWAAFSSERDLVIPPAGGGLVHQLGANTVVTDGRWYSSSENGLYTGGEGGQPLERLILRSNGAQGLPFGVSLTDVGPALRFEIRLPQPLPDGQHYHVRVHGERYDSLLHWVNIASSATLLAEGKAGGGTAEVRQDCSGYRCQIGFPWRAFPRSFRQGPARPMVLEIMRSYGSGDARDIAMNSGEFDVVLIAPLQIVRR